MTKAVTAIALFVALLSAVVAVHALEVYNLDNTTTTYAHQTGMFGARPGSYWVKSILIIGQPSDLCGGNFTNAPASPTPAPAPAPTPVPPSPPTPPAPPAPAPPGPNAKPARSLTFPTEPMDPVGGNAGSGTPPIGFMVIIKRGGCTFVEKAKTAQAAGATAIIIANYEDVPTGMYSGGGTPSGVTIPVVSVASSTYTALVNAVQTRDAITISGTPKVAVSVGIVGDASANESDGPDTVWPEPGGGGGGEEEPPSRGGRARNALGHGHGVSSGTIWLLAGALVFIIVVSCRCVMRRRREERRRAAYVASGGAPVMTPNGRMMRCPPAVQIRDALPYDPSSGLPYAATTPVIDLNSRTDPSIPLLPLRSATQQQPSQPPVAMPVSVPMAVPIAAGAVSASAGASQMPRVVVVHSTPYAPLQ